MEGKKFKMTNRRKKLKDSLNKNLKTAVETKMKEQQVIVEARNESHDSEYNQSPDILDINKASSRSRRNEEDQDSVDATVHNSQFSRSGQVSQGCWEFTKENCCKIFLSMILTFSIFGTAFMSYNLWIKRDDLQFSVDRFRDHTETMKVEIANLTE